MFRLIYFSSAVVQFSNDDLKELLSKARENNARLGITGLLLYKDGNFMQILEGEEDLVKQLYISIVRDQRHSDKTVIVEENVNLQLFSSWAMGFRDLSDPELENLPGYSQFMNRKLTPESFANSDQACLDLLHMFKRHG